MMKSNQKFPVVNSRLPWIFSVPSKPLSDWLRTVLLDDDERPLLERWRVNPGDGLSMRVSADEDSTT